jgi:predicted permease
MRGVSRREELEREMDEEMRFHLQMSEARNLRRGMSEAEARRLAAVQFGGVEAFKEDAREEQRARGLENLAGDVRFAWRTLGRTPSFAIAAILTIALGIGANTAVFSVVNGVLLRPLPMPAPHEIVYVGWDWGTGSTIPTLSAFQYEFVREHSTSLRAVATYGTSELHIGAGETTRPTRGLRASPEFFDVVGVSPALGRAFDDEENAPGGPDVVVLGHGVWRAQFGGDSALLGRSVMLDGAPRRVIGIMPPAFRLPDVPDHNGYIVPLRLEADPADEGHNSLVIARAKTGLSDEQRTAELAALTRSFREQHPELANAREQFTTLSYADVFVGDLRRTLWVLLGAVTLVLLIACANTATLLLVRGTARQQEMAVRATLGAGRGRLLQQLLTEGVLLSLVAGAIGLLISTWGVRLLLAVAPDSIPRVGEIGVDGRVLGYTLVISVATGLVFGLAAAAPALGRSLSATLRDGGRTTGARGRVRDLLVLAETAFAVVLLAGASLLIVSFAKLTSVDAGFDAESVAAVRIGRLPPDYGDETRAQLEQRVLTRLAAIPGVTAVASASNFPLERGGNFPVDTRERPELGLGAVELRSVTPEYFESLGVPLIAGRTFNSLDAENAPRVAIVNETFARRFWPGENPVGRFIQVGHFKDRWIDASLEGQTLVVGLVADMREIGLDLDPKPTVLLSRSQHSLGGPAILVRGAQPSALIPGIRAGLLEVDSRLTPEVEPMERIISRSIAEPRFRMLLLGTFAAAALLLAAIGIYGVIASSVQQRTREIGLRMALGATRSSVVGAIMWRCLRLVGGGMLAGAVLSLWLHRFVSGMLYGTTAADPIALAVVALGLLVVGAAAGAVPALRAARLDPARTLRSA